jgi:hypothetical protein
MYLFLPALKPAAEAEAGANIRRVGNRQRFLVASKRPKQRPATTTTTHTQTQTQTDTQRTLFRQFFFFYLK